MSLRTFSVAAALLLCASMPVAAQSVTIEFDNGMVNLRAENATVRAILAEWTRLGGTEIMNGDRVPGAPVTLELAGVSERQALDILLRNASGYIVGPRQVAAGNGSAYNRIMILPTSSAPQNQPAPPPAFAPAFSPDLPFEQDFPSEFGDPPDVPQDFLPQDDFDDPDFDPRLNQRFRAPRDFVPPDGVDGQPMPPQPFQPQPDEDPALDAPGQPPAVPPGFPFGVPGSARPGIVVPVPQQNPAGRPPQIGDDR